MTRTYIAFGLCFLAILSIVHVQDLTNEWAAFVQEYNKDYANEKEEYDRRLIWEENVKRIQQHNDKADRGHYTYWLKVNKYSDMTDGEFYGTMGTNIDLPLEPEADSHEETRRRLYKRFVRKGKGFVTQVNDMTKEWKSFIQEFNKHYADEKEEEYRRQVWEKNVRMIQEHNAEADRGKYTYWLSVNRYADMTDDEFNQMMNGLSTNLAEPPQMDADSYEKKKKKKKRGKLPKTFDWRQKGFNSSVKNQGRSCNSCYAFASLGALEGHHFKKTGELVSLSEQNIIDCTDDDRYGNVGCHGGNVLSSFKYIKVNGGVDLEKSYPYTGKLEKCRFNRTSVGSKLKKYRKIKSGKESQMKKIVVKRGPVAAEMDGSGDFRHYSHGVYNPKQCSQTNLTHAVVVLGYGKQKKKDGKQKKQKYWILKNSYGKSWGIHGYMHLVRGKKNICGIASRASYPIV